VKKTNIDVIPVTAEIDGERVVVGEASLATTKDGVQAYIQFDLDTPEGLNIKSLINRGLTNAISVSSNRADLVSKLAEQNKLHKEENPDDGTA